MGLFGRKDEAHGGHLKKNTAGTSNEISFSVLDGKKKEMDAVHGEGSLIPGFGKPRLFTLHGDETKALPPATGRFSLPSGIAAKKSEPSSKGLHSATQKGEKADSTQWNPPADEIQRRKKSRRRTRVLGAIGVVAIVAVVAGAVGLFVHGKMEEQKATQDGLSEALSIVESTDKLIIDMDNLVISHINGDTKTLWTKENMEKYAKLGDQLNNASASLKSARNAADKAATTLFSAEDKEAANQVLSTIGARQEMIDAGKDLLAVSVSSYNASSDVSVAWQTIIQADSLARDAAALVSNPTETNLQASISKTNAAIEKFAEGGAVFTQISNDYSQMDFLDYREYVEKRITSLRYALASDEALIAHDKDLAQSKNEEYSKADAEAVAIAKTLPTDPAERVEAAFKSSNKQLGEKYLSSRAIAITADTYLRSYLQNK